MHTDTDSDSLPDINEIFSPQPTTITPGDIVWAKFKSLYWPALVRAVYPSQKKISIWYCDEPGKTFKLPLKNVCLFYDAEKYEQIRKDVKEADCLEEHEGLKSHATDYLRRKAEGYKDDPSKFFDQTYPFYFVEEMLKKDPTADVSNIKIRPMYISNEKKQTLRQRISISNNEPDDSDLEAADSDTEIKNCNAEDYVSKVHQQLQENMSKHCKVGEDVIDKITEFVLSGQADDYLQKIKLKRSPSEHRDLFEQSVKKKKKDITKICYTGPIDDDNQVKDLTSYLLTLYEKFDKSVRNRRFSSRKGKVKNSFSAFNKDTVEGHYVAAVFLPESIIFALSKIKNMPLKKARSLFINYKTETFESILKRVDPIFLKNDRSEHASDPIDKDSFQNKEHHKALECSADDDASMCSQVKKKRIDKLDN